MDTYAYAVSESDATLVDISDDGVMSVGDQTVHIDGANLVLSELASPALWQVMADYTMLVADAIGFCVESDGRIIIRGVLQESDCTNINLLTMLLFEDDANDSTDSSTPATSTSDSPTTTDLPTSTIDTSVNATSSTTDIAISTTTSGLSCAAQTACLDSPIGDVAALYDTTQVYTNFYTGCGSSLEGAVGGLGNMDNVFAVNWPAPDYSGYTFNQAVSRCIQFAVDNPANIVEFYQDVNANWLCVGVNGKAPVESIFACDSNVQQVWGFSPAGYTGPSSSSVATTTSDISSTTATSDLATATPSCTDMPTYLGDQTLANGTVYNNFYADCGTSLQGNTPGGLGWLPRQMSVNWPYPDYSGWTFNDAVARCAQGSADMGSTVFEFYYGTDMNWYCISVDDVYSNADSFYTDVEVLQVWGFSVDTSTLYQTPSYEGTCDPNVEVECYDCDLNGPCYCATNGVCGAPPSPDCTFSDDGSYMMCPVSNDSGLKARDLQNVVVMNATAMPTVRRDFERSFTHAAPDSYRYRRGSSRAFRRDVGMMPRQDSGPLVDAWNFLLWTAPLTYVEVATGVSSTITAASFTLNVYPGGSTQWPSLTATPALVTVATVPACIPATFISPAAQLLKRDVVSAKPTATPYVERESTTVKVKLRENYLQLTSNVPTITQQVPLGGTTNGPLALVTSSSYIESAESGTRGSQTVVIVSATSDDGSTATDAASGGGGGGGGGVGGNSTDPENGVEALSPHQRVINLPFTQASYVGALYFPTILAVFIQILFEAIVASVKMMEPFERLHRLQGATAEASLFSQYLESTFTGDVMRSIVTGRWIPVWTFVLYLLITIAQPISSSSMSVQPMDRCYINGGWYNCDPEWILDIRFVRALEAILVVSMAVIVGLCIVSWRFHAGVPTNPTSIASIAVFTNYEPLRQDLLTLPGAADDEELEKLMGDHHFWLVPHSQTRTSVRYGFYHAPTSTLPSVSPLDKIFAQAGNRYEKIIPEVEEKRKTMFYDALHIISTLALLVLLIAYRADLNDDAFNKFFTNSNSTWPKFVVVGLCTINCTQWKGLERKVRITEPYRRLWEGNARPENTILCALNGTCWTNAPRCFRHLFSFSHMWFETLIGVIACLSDINIIAVSGVLMTFSQTKGAYEFSSLCALVITSMMSTVVFIVVFWWRKHPCIATMPRIPENIGAVLSYLAGSRMAFDFSNMALENLSQAQRDEIIISKGLRYKFGKVTGEDGKERFVVDYDDPHLGGAGEKGAYDETNQGDWNERYGLRFDLKKPDAVRVTESEVPEVPDR